MHYSVKSIFAVLVCMNASTAIFAQDSKEKTILQFGKTQFSFDGVMFLNYENPDYNGKTDPANSRNRTQGFRMDRAYFTFRGNVKDGNYKDLSFRLTTDVELLGTLGDGCRDNTCERSNEYIPTLKYAYINLPLVWAEGFHVRAGIQHNPVNNAKYGLSVQEDGWAHRYIERPVWTHIDVVESADAGISLIYKGSEYFGYQFLYSNGEGFRTPNADRITDDFKTDSDILDRMASGSGDSYGHSLFAAASLIPTGKNSDFHFSLTFPAAVYNLSGIDESEYRYATYDLCNGDPACRPAAPELRYFQGNKRAYKDSVYGATLIMKQRVLPELEWVIGTGAVELWNRQSSAYRFDPDSIQAVTNDLSSWNDYARISTDEYGRAYFIYGRLRYRSFALLARFVTGTSDGSLSPTLGSFADRSWLEKTSMADLQDATPGNLTFIELLRATGEAPVFRNYTLAITYYYAEAIALSLGTTITVSETSSGKLQTNRLENIRTFPGSDTTLAGQIEQNRYTDFGYDRPGIFTLNDYIGERAKDTQIFFRARVRFSTYEDLAKGRYN